MLSTAGFIVRGLQELPGRKSLVLFSESIQLADAPKALNNPLATTMSPGGMGDVREQTIKAIRSLVDLANKSGVTFYTINPRGLQPLAATAGIRWLATLDAIQWARINSIPFLGTCGGFQHAVIEYARNVLHWNEADHAESNPTTAMPLIASLACSLVEKTEAIRLVPGSRISNAYREATVVEGYHCSYGLNPEFQTSLFQHPLIASAFDENGEVRAIELGGHPFYVATLFQPERRALKGEVPPLVKAFCAAISDT